MGGQNTHEEDLIAAVLMFARNAAGSEDGKVKGLDQPAGGWRAGRRGQMSLHKGAAGTTVNVGCCRGWGPGLDKTEVETRGSIGWRQILKSLKSQDWGFSK